MHKSAVGAEGDSKGTESPKRGTAKRSARSGSDGIGAVGTGVGARDTLRAERGGSQRQPRARNARWRVDLRGRRPWNPAWSDPETRGTDRIRRGLNPIRNGSTALGTNYLEFVRNMSCSLAIQETLLPKITTSTYMVTCIVHCWRWPSSGSTRKGVIRRYDRQCRC